MSHRKKNSNDLSRFLRYSGNRMKGKERNAFEKELQKDPFDAEAAEGLSMVTPREVKEDIEDIRQRLSGQKGRRRPVFIMRAAAVAGLLVASTLIFNLLRKEYDEPLLSENMPVKTVTKTLPVAASEGVRRAAAEPDSEEPVTSAVVNAVKSSYPTGTVKDTDKINTPAAEYVVSDIQIAQLEEKKVSNHIIMEQMEAKARSASAGKLKRSIEGTVISSEDGLPIPGVSIYIKGTNRGTVSNIEGKFELSAETDSALMLVAKFVGMEPQEVTAKPDSDLLIAMNNDNMALEEVVVVGYGVSRKEDQEEAVPVHIEPQPEGGSRAFREYIEENIVYPAGIVKKTREVVVISMMVRSNGSIENITIVRSPGQAFSDEAIRLIKDGPQWNPATVDGITQNEEVKVRLVFDERE